MTWARRDYLSQVLQLLSIELHNKEVGKSCFLSNIFVVYITTLTEQRCRHPLKPRPRTHCYQIDATGLYRFFFYLVLQICAQRKLLVHLHLQTTYISVIRCEATVLTIFAVAPTVPMSMTYNLPRTSSLLPRDLNYMAISLQAETRKPSPASDSTLSDDEMTNWWLQLLWKPLSWL